jgi:hypothetical protein
MNSNTVSVLEGNTFVVGRRNGDVDAGPGEPHGLFHRDTRYLSRWLLTIDGKKLDPLSSNDTKSFSADFFLVPGTGSEYTDAKLSVIRRRVVGDGFFEEPTVLNHGTEPIRPEIAIAVGADFADLFQVKDATIATRAAWSTCRRCASIRARARRWPFPPRVCHGSRRSSVATA